MAGRETAGAGRALLATLLLTLALAAAQKKFTEKVAKKATTEKPKLLGGEFCKSFEDV